MELRQLRYFVAVAEERHFGRAAARLLISTPSLSQQIKALERDLGVRLFERTPAGATPTVAAHELMPLARATLEAAAEVRQAATRIGEERATVLHLGFLAFALTAPSRDLLTRFGREAPQISVEMHQHEWDDPSAGLLSQQTDAALVRPPFTGADQLELLEVAQEPVFAVAASTSPIAAQPEVTLAQVAQEPILEAEIVTDPVFAAHWYLRDLRPPSAARVISRAATVEEWLSEVSFGRGVNVVPGGLAAQYERPGITFVPVVDAPGSSIALAWRPGDVTPGAQSLIALARRRRRAQARQRPSRRAAALP